jgi:large subunit ribosomal protein L2
MAVKKYKPTTPGRRGASVQDFSDITKKRPEKSLVSTIKKTAGRNNTGQITIRHRGGGVKRLYRKVDFARTRYDMPATVTTIEYDPNRGPRIALMEFEDGEKAYYLVSEGMKVGTVLLSSQSAIEPVTGNRMPIGEIPVGLSVYNIELEPGKKGTAVRSAGASAKIQTIEGKYAQLKMPSGEIRLVQKECMATVGRVGNSDYGLVRLGKAGRRRKMGWRPSVRGKVMNPVDHPHGGGEGASPIGMKAPKTPWGKKALGVKTRKKNRPSSALIVRRRNDGKRK